jgi:hypothetical protein
MAGQALETVADYVAEARVILEDKVPPYRYPDDDLVTALNIAIREARRVRPDLFLSSKFVLPKYTTADTTAVAIDEQYRSTFLYFIVGRAQLRDEEQTEDARAAAYLNKFVAQLTVLMS